MLQLEYAGADVSRAPVSFGGGQRIGRDRQPLDLLMQASSVAAAKFCNFAMVISVRSTPLLACTDD